MSDNMTSVTIKRILNLPIENQKTVEINYNFSIELSKNFHHIMIDDDIMLKSKNDFTNQINNNNIQINKEYQCPTLWMIDDMGKEYTMYSFSYMLIQRASKWYIQFCFNGILEGGHLNEELEKQKFDRVETEVRCDREIDINHTYDPIKCAVKPIYIQDESYKKLMSKWLSVGDDDSSENIFDHKLKITLSENKTFKEFEKILWWLSEFAFLCCEDMFFYDTLSVFIEGNPYTLKYYLRANYAKSRRSNLRTNDFHSRIFCGNAFNEDNFASFLIFRKDSDIIFDVFRTTVYSDTFREDYPLRLSQTLEGLANYLGIADTQNYDDFYTAILHSLKNNEFIKYTHREAQDFCNKITNHRHKFSHVKNRGSYLKGDENEKSAEILYTTIRVLIIKRINGEI